MDTLRQYYSSQPQTAMSHQNTSRVSENNMFFDPVYSRKWKGNFPLMIPKKKVVHELEEYPTMIFQHVPTFSYYPNHSNIDVDLE